MHSNERYYRARQLTSAPATCEKIYTVKSGKMRGLQRKISAKPARVGILPISEKTLWVWVRTGKFPQPIRLSSNCTVWRESDVKMFIDKYSSSNVGE